MSFIGTYLTKAVAMRASDIHLKEKEPALVRIDGGIALLDENYPDMEAVFKELYELCSEDLREHLLSEIKKLRDVSISFAALDGKYRVRATLYRDEKGKAVSMRIISGAPSDISTLGLPETLLNVCTLNRGLFIVTGATGSGKSTTLAAMINQINKTRAGHIITLEDPIEYIIPSERCLVTHREIGRHVESFATGLRSILREDPNVVVIGDLRDLESMRAAVQIAETGHLVLTTLHTRNAPSTIDRLIGSFPPDDQHQIRMMLADNLIGVLAQTLIPRRDSGRIGAFELLLNNDAVKNNIREAKIYQIENTLQTGAKQGMICMEDYIIELIRQGFVEYETALAFAPSKAKLEAKLKAVFG